jgi:hypothetical protein
MWIWHSPPWNFPDWPSQPSRFWIAAAANLGKTAKFLLEGPLLPYFPGTEIIAASYYDHIDIIQLLGERGTDSNAQIEPYASACCVALVKHHQKVAELLLSNLNKWISKHGDTVNLIPDSHPDELATPNNHGNSVGTFTSLHDLASALQTRFEQTGQLADLE